MKIFPEMNYENIFEYGRWVGLDHLDYPIDMLKIQLTRSKLKVDFYYNNNIMKRVVVKKSELICKDMEIEVPGARASVYLHPDKTIYTDIECSESEDEEEDGD